MLEPELREKLLNSEVKQGKIRIYSTGSPDDTHVLLDDVEIPLMSLTIPKVEPGSGPIVALLEVFVNDLDIYFESNVIVVKPKKV